MTSSCPSCIRQFCSRSVGTCGPPPPDVHHTTGIGTWGSSQSTHCPLSLLTLATSKSPWTLSTSLVLNALLSSSMVLPTYFHILLVSLAVFTLPFHNPFKLYIPYPSPVIRDLPVVLLQLCWYYNIRATCITQCMVLHMLVAIDILSLSQYYMYNVILLEGNCASIVGLKASTRKMRIQVTSTNHEFTLAFPCRS